MHVHKSDIGLPRSLLSESDDSFTYCLALNTSRFTTNCFVSCPLGHERNCNKCDNILRNFRHEQTKHVLRDLALLRWCLHLTLRGLREAAAILLPSQVTQRMLHCTSGGSNQISVKLSCQEISRDHWRKNIQSINILSTTFEAVRSTTFVPWSTFIHKRKQETSKNVCHHSFIITQDLQPYLC